MTDTALLIGEFITIPAWQTSGQVIATRPAMIGSEQAVEVLIETKPNDPSPRWYRLEPTEYEVL